MARFGGNEFVGFSVPLVFDGRYFVMEPGLPPIISVFIEHDGVPVFEILKNNPVSNTVTDVTTNPSGVITVARKNSVQFLYKLRPDSETSVVFGRIDGQEMSVRITDRKIRIGGSVLENNTFVGNMAGVTVSSNGSLSIGSILPPIVVRFLTGNL